MSARPDTAGLRRTWLRGYRTSDVEIALARSSLELERLRLEVDAGRSRARAMQMEIDHLHGRIDAYRGREAELDASIAELRQQRDLLQREAQAKSETIVADAERRAAGLRTESLRELGELQDQVEQLLSLKARLVRAFRSAGEQIENVLESISLAAAQADEAPAPGTRPVDDLRERLSHWTRDEP
ncbi:MAG TPA: DivIVA domain-containing protein [Gaiellaceae bacterium]|jgi:chromosome segregation ATPase|nr:DivIVA domain-containing protein [Gaiellaceae bacterium]